MVGSQEKKVISIESRKKNYLGKPQVNILQGASNTSTDTLGI